MIILKDFIKKIILSSEIFNFSYNLEKYLQTNLAITRSGFSMLAELTNAKLPFISVPLPLLLMTISLKMLFIIKEKN